MSDRFRFLEYGDEDAPKADAPAARKPFREAAPLLAEALEAYQEGEFDRALRRYSAVVQEHPDRPEGWEGQVRCLLRMDALQEAVTWATKALERHPESSGLHGALSVVLAVGRNDEALHVSDRAMTLAEADRNVQVLVDRGACLLVLGDVENAARCFDRAREVGGADTVEAIGLACALAEHHAMAAEHLEAALQHRPRSAWLWLQAARASRLAGNIRAARRQVEQALSLKPHWKAAAAEKREIADSPWWAFWR